MSCPDCFKGAVHNHGTPVGKFETLHGYRTYIAGNPEKRTSSSTIIYLPDAFSLKLVNNKILADRYADGTGCRVLVPDIIPGGGANPESMTYLDIAMRPAGYDIFAWAKRILAIFTLIYMFVPFLLQTNIDKNYVDILAYARAVRADMPLEGKLGVCGFCWGGHGSTNLCTETALPKGTTRLIDAQFCAHPSKLKAPDMIVEAITKYRTPYSIALAEKDFGLSLKTAEETEAIVRSKIGPPEENDYEFVTHKGCSHGFAVRASPENKVEFQGLEDACEQAVRWFKRYL